MALTQLETVDYSIEGRVGRVILNRPQVNAWREKRDPDY